MTAVQEAPMSETDDARARDGSIPKQDQDRWRFAARVVLTLAVFGLAAFLLRNYLRALVWAVVLAIALWPLFHRIASKAPARLRTELMPTLFACGVALVLIVPFALVGLEGAREAHAVFDEAQQAEQNGLEVPDAVSRLPPSVAKPLSDWWTANLSHSGWAKDYARRLDTTSNRELGRTLGRDAIHRLVLLGFAILTLFFLFRDGDALRQQCLTASQRLLGPRGERIGRQAIASIHGTVNGLVLVGLGEGVVLGVVYAVTGVPHAVLFGAFTAVAAMVPFAAAVAFGLAAVVVLAAGKVVSAIIVVVAGFLTTFTADHFIRPVLIGGATRLPFLWVLLGILAGVETFGLLGLFLGPALMAVAILLWREVADAEKPVS